jgi:hypothetical protein
MRGGGVKRSASEAGHTVPSGAEAKNKWSYVHFHFFTRALGASTENLTLEVTKCYMNPNTTGRRGSA